MTRDEVISMAREAGLIPPPLDWPQKYAEALARFAVLVAAAEREACAKECEYRAETGQVYSDSFAEADGCAAAIRARSNT